MPCKVGMLGALKERAWSKSVGPPFFLSPTRYLRAPGSGSGSGLGWSPTAKRPEGLDAGPVRPIRFGVVEDGWLCLLGLEGWGRGFASEAISHVSATKRNQNGP
ncbi:MAG: hypothetical protein JWO11_3487 [Nocardioides sp.]|nr:hypothetical protein [Nocardioides sp.]